MLCQLELLHYVNVWMWKNGGIQHYHIVWLLEELFDMCICCFCASLREKIEGNYVMNHDAIIIESYDFFRTIANEEDNKIEFTHQADKQKFENILNRLRKVQELVENGADVNDVLRELEVDEYEMIFLSRIAKYENLKNRTFHSESLPGVITWW